MSLNYENLIIINIAFILSSSKKVIEPVCVNSLKRGFVHTGFFICKMSRAIGEDLYYYVS